MPLDGIRTVNPSRQAAVDPRLRPRRHKDRFFPYKSLTHKRKQSHISWANLRRFDTACTASQVTGCVQKCVQKTQLFLICTAVGLRKLTYTNCWPDWGDSQKRYGSVQVLVWLNAGSFVRVHQDIEILRTFIWHTLPSTRLLTWTHERNTINLYVQSQ